MKVLMILEQDHDGHTGDLSINPKICGGLPGDEIRAWINPFVPRIAGPTDNEDGANKKTRETRR